MSQIACSRIACGSAYRPARYRASVVLLALILLLTLGAQSARAQTGPANITSLNLTDPVYNAATGTLTATAGTVTGTFAGAPFTTNITNFVLQRQSSNGGRCSVLNLELAPINIALLGLHADTSQICLAITAFEGRGLLGDLLCGLAGGNLDLLGSPGLLSGLTQILNQALARAHHAPPGHGGSVCTGECEVLDLVLGPLTLNLLGVQVKLDNCANGPVEVCVSATASEGLLGSLLCGLADGGAILPLQAITNLVQAILAGL